jgi:hypothetical protein
MISRKHLCWVLSLLFVNCNAPSNSIKHGTVYISKEGEKYTLYRNGQPFTIKGASGYTHLEKLREIGGNTIRTWDTVNLGAILDEAQRHNLTVIAGLSMPVSAYLDYFYKDTAKVAAQYRAFEKTVRQYKDHPALLMWCLGNELNFTWKPGYGAFYKTYNRLLDMIHTTDPDHPVTTTMPNLNIVQTMMIKWKVHNLDLISINTFGKLKLLNDQLKRYAWCWNGPFLITEWGAYGPWESERTNWEAPIENTSTKKAEHYRLMYGQLPQNNPRFLGALVFYWGQKQETTPTWFSMFDEGNGSTEAVSAIQYLWTGKGPSHQPPQIKYMLLNNKGARDNIVLPSGRLQTAELLLGKSRQDTLSIHWQILQEHWFGELEKPPLTMLDTLLPADNKLRLTFKAPIKEGPYRIYAKVMDNHGNFSTANTPFYVVE